MEAILALAIPILALFIPLIALTGYFVVQPLVKVLGQLVVSQERGPESELARQRIAELEARLERMERLLTRVVEEQRFHHALNDGSAQSGPAETRPPSLPHG